MKDQEIELWQMRSKPITIAGGAVYPYKDSWISIGEREAKYPDEDGNTQFNLFRVVGVAPHRRIWVPRNMVANWTTPDIDQRVSGPDVQFQSTFKARNTEQARVIKECGVLLKADQSFMFRAPTGFGKTYCAAQIIADVGKKTVITVTKEDIVEQWVKALQECLGLELKKDIGFIAGDTCDTVGKKVVIAMVQSLAKESRYPEYHFRDFGFAIWDECHRIGADFFSQSCFRVPALLRMGISATPRRKDGREEVLHAHIGPVRVASEALPMTPRVIVQESPWYCPKTVKIGPDDRIVIDSRTGKPEMVPIPHNPGRCSHVTKMLMHHHHRNRIITNFVGQAYKAGRKILVQSDFKEHLEMLASLFPTQGIPVTDIKFYVGGMKSAQRERAKQARIIMATYQMTSEATDIEDADTLVMATPKSDIEQIAGRVLRYVKGKDPLIFDIQDMTSPVFAGYAYTRLHWYKSKGAAVKEQNEKAPNIDKQGKSVTITSTLK